MKKLIFVISFFLALALASYIIYREGVLPVNKDDTSKKTIVIEKGATVDAITNKLFLEKLIRNRIAFYVVVKQLGLERFLQAGDFELSPSMDAYTIAKSLTKGSLDVWVTIPEGLRKEEVAEIFSKELPSLSVAELVNSATEGYLFPDTYLVPKASNAETVLGILKSTFQTKLGKIMDDNKDKIARLGLTNDQVIVLASLVEREAQLAEDRQPIASIYIRRLNEPMRLQVDATVQYALGYDTAEKTWWKKALTFEDLKIDSVYNTYERDGLPPRAICNPGLSSIQAVIDADPSTPYLFYVNDIFGKLHFAKDLTDHNKNVEKYVNGK